MKFKKNWGPKAVTTQTLAHTGSMDNCFMFFIATILVFFWVSNFRYFLMCLYRSFYEGDFS